jgi:hypothetical protein
LAIVSAIALLVALGLAALLSLQPWATNPVAPQLSVAPGLGIGLGDSVVVSRNRQLAVAPAQPAMGVRPRLIAAGVAVEEGESQPRLGIAAARVVASPQPGAPSQGSPQPSQPESIPAPPPSPVPAVVPVATPPPSLEPVAAPPTRGAGGGTPGPVGAGGGAEGGGVVEILQVCEGDDYTLPLSPVEVAEGSEVPPPVVPHDLTVYFGRSSEATGFYLVLFDGQPVEIGDDPVLIEPGKSCAQIDLGPLLGELIGARTEIRIEAVTLGDTLEPVVP